MNLIYYLLGVFTLPILVVLYGIVVCLQVRRARPRVLALMRDGEEHRSSELGKKLGISSHVVTNVLRLEEQAGQATLRIEPPDPSSPIRIGTYWYRMPKVDA